jgi:hypothetical protein
MAGAPADGEPPGGTGEEFHRGLSMPASGRSSAYLGVLTGPSAVMRRYVA